jgi:hypothetical protein
MLGSSLVTTVTLVAGGRFLATSPMSTGDKIWFVMLIIGGIGGLAALAASMYGLAKHAVEKRCKKKLREYAQYLSQDFTEDDALHTSYERCLYELEKETGLDLHGE